MNAISIAELVQLSHRPEEAFNFPVMVQTPEMTVYEERAMTAVISNFVMMGITKISRPRKVGRVMSFEAHPYQKKDPTIIVCNEMDLSLYYKEWGNLVGNKKYDNGYSMESYSLRTDNFSNAIRAAIRSARSLTKEEVAFAIIEMLTFQNEMMCR